MFRELKARKAKYGFDYGCITIGGVVALAEFIKALNVSFGEDSYVFEESGYNRPSLKLYTDREDVAIWIRNYLAIAS